MTLADVTSDAPSSDATIDDAAPAPAPPSSAPTNDIAPDRPFGVADARIVQDADGVIVSIDTHAERVYGWPIADLVGARAPMMVHPDDREIVATVRNRVRTSGIPQHVQIRVRTFGGRWLWVECAFRQLALAAAGEARHTELELRDVSARYLRDEALQLLVDVRALIDGAESFDEALREGLDRLAQWGGFDAAACWQPSGTTWARTVTVECALGARSIHPPPGCDRCESLAVEVAKVARRRVWAWAELGGVATPTGLRRSCGEARPLLIPVVAADATIAVLELRGVEAAVTEGSVDLVCEVARQLGDAIRRRQVESELELARRHFALAFDAAAIGMALVAPDGAFLDVNASMCQLLGRDRRELLAVTYPDVAHPDDFAADRPALRDMLLGRRSTHQVEKRYLRADGTTIWGQLSVALVRDERGEPLHFICQIQDISQRRHAEAELERTIEQLARNERRYRSLIEPSADIIARIGVDGRIADLNHRAAAAIGADATDVVGRHLRDLLPAELANSVLDHVSNVAATGRPDEIWREWLAPADRAPGWFVIRLMPEAPADESGYVEHVHLMASDITELVESEQRLSEMALIDPLTGVANRVAVFDRLQHALDRLDRRPGTGIAVAVVDLDHFKQINDRHGHAVGDDALRVASDALRSAVRLEDTVGRLGGDEFIVVFEDAGDRETSAVLGERLRAGLAASAIRLDDGTEWPISGSVGVAHTDRPVPMNELVARADRAMYAAKRQGRSHRSNDTEPTEHARHF